MQYTVAYSKLVSSLITKTKHRSALVTHNGKMSYSELIEIFINKMFALHKIVPITESIVGTISISGHFGSLTLHTSHKV